jgi:ABC-2 type transport system permease protein
VGWVTAVGVLALFVLALSWVSAAFGVLTRSTDAANGFGFFLSFLAYPSSAFVPLDDMPTWLQGFARHQPVTQTVEAVRALLLDQPAGPVAVRSVVWSLGIVVCSAAAAAALHRRRAD